MRPWYPSDRRDASVGDPIVRAIRREADGDEPDPHFKRRLRGALLSHHVAVREGYPLPVTPAVMTPIGRGVLVASVLVAVGVTGVGAASQAAIPDDPLYGVKLRIEELRLVIAPVDLRDDLVAMGLDERINELQAAVANGRWHAAGEAATRVTQAEQRLDRLGGPPPAVAARLAQHLALLDGALASAPDGTRRQVNAQIAPARAAIGTANGQGGGGAAGRGGTAGGNGGSSGTNGTDTPSASPKPGNGNASRSPTSEPTPRPTPRASHSPRGSSAP